MKKIFLLLLNWFILTNISFAQNIGIGTTPNPSAQLDISSSNKGLLIPRMTAAQVSSIPNPAKGLLVMDTTMNLLMINAGSPSSPVWQSVAGSTGWGISGNNGTNAASNFIGTIDAQPLYFRIQNINAGSLSFFNASFGYNAFTNASTGKYNCAFGRTTLKNNTTGDENTAMGDEALLNNTIGINNVAIGSSALKFNTTANDNTAVGTSALESNTVGTNNSAFGKSSSFANTTGFSNTSFGYDAAFFTSTGSSNCSFGIEALYRNITGGVNAAFGAFASYNNTSSSNSSFGDHVLFSNTTGSYNAGFGASDLYSNTSGTANTALGSISLQTNTTGNYNTAVGSGSDVLAGNLTNATVIGANAIVSASNCLVLGSVNGVNSATSSVNVGIGLTTPLYTLHVKERFPNSADGIMTEYDADKKWITQVDANNNYVFEKWNAFINGFNIMGYVSGSTGQYIQISDRSLKKNISPLNNKQGLDKLMQLNPVRYQFATEPSSANYTYGFISQEVEPVFPDIVVENHGIKMMGYSSFIPILTKGIQEQQQQIGSLQHENAALKITVISMQSILKKIQQQLDQLQPK